MTQVGSSPGAGQFTQSGAVFTFSAADAGKVMTITYVYSVPGFQLQRPAAAEAKPHAVSWLAAADALELSDFGASGSGPWL